MGDSERPLSDILKSHLTAHQSYDTTSKKIQLIDYNFYYASKANTTSEHRKEKWGEQSDINHISLTMKR